MRRGRGPGFEAIRRWTRRGDATPGTGYVGGSMNPWLLLFCGIAAEVVSTTALKASEGFKRPLSSLAVVVFFGLSFFLFSQSLTGIPLGTAYAVWAGIGVAATALVGMAVFREALTLPRAGGMALVLAGVVALNLSGGGASP